MTQNQRRIRRIRRGLKSSRKFQPYQLETLRHIIEGNPARITKPRRWDEVPSMIEARRRACEDYISRPVGSWYQPPTWQLDPLASASSVALASIESWTPGPPRCRIEVEDPDGGITIRPFTTQEDARMASVGFPASHIVRLCDAPDSGKEIAARIDGKWSATP